MTTDPTNPDRSATDTALTNIESTLEKERAAEDAEDVVQNAELKKAQDDLAAAQADDTTEAAGCRIGVCPPLNNLFGHVPNIVRIFLMSDQPIPLSGVPDSAMIVVSRGSRGEWFGNRLAEANERRNGPVIGVAGQHEPENDVAKGAYSLQFYKDWVKEDAALFESLSIPSAQVLMGGTCNAGTWEQWVVPEAKQLWWDVYHGGAGKIPETYKAPENWLKVYFDANIKINKPIGFAEFGSRTTAADAENYAAPNFLNWVKANSNYCKSHPTLKAAAWFNFGKRIRITNQAFADAWFKGI